MSETNIGLGAGRKGIFGVVLVAVSLSLLHGYEARAVRQHRALQEVGGAVVSVPADRVESRNEGKLVHVCGPALPDDEMLSDVVFGVTLRALRLRRIVEMYQWRELGNAKDNDYRYDLVWSRGLVDSRQFHSPGRDNPPEMPFPEREWAARRVMVGAFTLGDDLARKIGPDFAQIAVPAGSVLPPEQRERGVIRAGLGYYLGRDPGAPAVGDVRVTFEAVLHPPVSVVARQSGDRLEPFPARSGENVALLSAGMHPAGEMLGKEVRGNLAATLVRWGFGFLLVWGGVRALRAEVLPRTGGTGGKGYVSLLVAGALTSTTVAAAWNTNRPLGSCALLAVAAVCALLAVRRKGTGAPPPSG